MSGIGDTGAVSSTVRLLDPKSGNVTRAVEFRFPESVHFGWDIGDDAQQDAQLVSPDLQYMAAYQTQADGTEQVGVVTPTGQFIDLSKPLSGAGSFSGAETSHRVLITNGRVYFDLSKTTGDDDRVYSIPLAKLTSSLTPSTYHKESIVQVPEETDVKFRVAPDGTVTKGSSCQKLRGGWGVEIDAVLSSSTFIQLDRGIEKVKLAGSCQDANNASGTELLPASSQQVEAAVTSPDQSTIALVASEGTTSTLYEVPARGGEPTKVSAFDASQGKLVSWLG